MSHYQLTLLAIGLVAIVTWASSSAAPAADMGSTPATGENLARGKSYTFSFPPNYPLCTDEGDATDLTDGVLVKTPPGSSLWGQKGCVGWQHSRAPVAITVDLGQVQPIAGAAMRCAANVAGVTFPSSIQIQVSEDGQNFVVAGDLVRLAEGPSPPPYNVYDEHVFKTARLATRGRYVRFNVVPSSIFLFADEIEVHRGDDALLTRPLDAQPASDSEITDPLRLTQLGVYRRIRSDIDSIKSIIGKRVPTGASRNEMLNELSLLGQQLDSQPAYPPSLDGFRAVVPVSELHKRILAVHGRALAASKVGPPLTLWHTPPYQMLDLFARPTGDVPASLSVRTMLGEHRAEALNITNASAEEKRVCVRFEGLPAPPSEILRVYQVEYVDTREWTPVASALVELRAKDGAYETIVPAGMTRQLWFSFNPREQSLAGEHAGQVIIESGDFKKAIDLNLSVAAISMPAQMSCSMGLWDYIVNRAYDITDANALAAMADMDAHLARTVWCNSSSAPLPKPADFDAQGNLTGAIDYTAWDHFVQTWPNAKQYLAFAYMHPDSTVAGLAAGTPAFDRLVHQWAADWARHNKEVLGLEPGRVMLLTLDEPGTHEHFLWTYQFSKPFSAGTDDILIFVDPVGTAVHEVENAKKALEQADVISPTLGQYTAGGPELRAFYQQLRAEGKQLWFYNCSGPTRHFDPAYFRLQPWHAFAAGGNGSQFWAYGDAGGANSWNEYAAVGKQSFTPVYIAPDGITTSKHWEAAREGVQDFEYLVMLQAKLNSMDKTSAERARRLLAEIAGDGMANKVAQHNKKNPRVFNNASAIGEELRLKILDLLRPAHTDNG